MPALRLLSIDARSFGRNRVALAKAIADAGADVVCVHGGPHLLRWRSISAAIGRRAGLVVVTGGRPAGANLLLSSLAVDVTAVRDILLTRAATFDRPGAALAALRADGTQFVLVSATMIGNAAQRAVQVRELRAAIEHVVPGDPPTIISAHGTDRPGTIAWQTLSENRVGLADGIFVDARVDVGEVSPLERGADRTGGAGARRPVVVELTL